MLFIYLFQIVESHAGFQSDSSPCSGFVTVDDDGVPCAGFRQCVSTKGVAGGQTWDVPLELRCKGLFPGSMFSIFC